MISQATKEILYTFPGLHITMIGMSETQPPIALPQIITSEGLASLCVDPPRTYVFEEPLLRREGAFTVFGQPSGATASLTLRTNSQGAELSRTNGSTYNVASLRNPRENIHIFAERVGKLVFAKLPPQEIHCTPEDHHTATVESRNVATKFALRGETEDAKPPAYSEEQRTEFHNYDLGVFLDQVSTSAVKASIAKRAYRRFKRDKAGQDNR
jgi:hypothetical protein